MRGVIVESAAGKQVTEGYLKIAAEKFQAGSGLATTLEDNGKAEMLVGTNEKVQLQHALDNDKDFKDRTMVFWFGGGITGNVHKDDLQPFVLIGSDKEPELVVFMDGNFQGYHKVDSAHTNAFFCMAEYLRPKLREMYEDSDNDIGKLMAKMDRKSFTDEMNKLILGDGGSIVFMNKNGTVKKFTSSPTAGQQEWGWTSDNLGWMQKPAEQPKPAAETGRRRLRGTTEDPPAAAPPQETPSEGAPPPIDQPLPGDTQKTGDITTSEPEYVMMAPPQEVRGGKTPLKKWYYEFAHDGKLPQGYKNFPSVKVLKSKLTKGLDNLDKLVKTDTSIPALEAGKAPIAETVVEATAEAIDAQKRENEGVRSINLSAEVREKIKSEFLEKNGVLARTVGSDGKAIFDPRKIVAETKVKVNNWAEQLGIPLESTFSYDIHDIARLYKIGGNAAVAILAMAWQKHCIQYEIDKLSGSETETVTAMTPQPQAAPPSVPQVAEGGRRRLR